MVDGIAGRILIVDDDASARFARARLLRDAGHTIFEAGCLEDARVLLREIRPELIVLDVRLPDGDGVEFARRIKQDDVWQGLMVLQMSASFVSDEDQVRGLDAGADAYLIEPAAPAVLRATVRALLRLGRTERALQDALRLEQVAREEAQAANQIKDDFLAALSHELRTPLNAIIGWTALLRRRPLTDEQRTHAIEVIDRNAKAQSSLIEELLDVSRIVLGQLRLTWDVVDIAPVVTAAVESIRPTADAKGLTLVADLDIDPTVQVRGDPTRLQQVLWNLLTNAAKFTPAGGRLRVRGSADEAGVQVAITDTGRGISPEFLPRIFERFRRGERSAGDVERGLGIGLTIARELTEMHGGTLTAESGGLNQGATFMLRLPRMAASGAPSATTTAASTGRTSAAS